MKRRQARRAKRLRVAKKRAWRSLRSRRLRRWRRAYETLQPGQTASRPIRNADTPCVILHAPPVFGLRDKSVRSTLVSFLTALKRLTLTERKKVKIDFRRTTLMYPDGTLLFAAELSRINQVTERTLVSCTRPANTIVDQLLQHLGVLAMMNYHGKAPVTADNVRYWKVESDVVVDGSRAEPMIDGYQQHFSDANSKRLFRGLTEAMTNCKQHAYTQSRDSQAPSVQDSRWWMFSQLKDGKLSVSICDLGIGINRSLQEGKKISVIDLLRLLLSLGLSGKKDSAYIKAALELGRSKTNLPNRGKGLPELKAVIEDVSFGFLQILSNKGLYLYVKGSSTRETLVEYKDSIFGTLISWQVTLPETEVSSSD